MSAATHEQPPAVAPAAHESDEQLARRMHDEELGIARRPLNPPRRRANPTVINQRLHELYTSAGTALFVFLANAPQVLAAAVVLSIHWTDPDVCNASYTSRWQIWSSLCALRLLAYTAIVLYLFAHRVRLQTDPPALVRTHAASGSRR